ncbi:hypothetical protein EG834_22025 [bacterium]|nr:hypothetical protein [bacterium]
MDRTGTVTMETPITGAVTVTTTLLPTIPCMIQAAGATPIPLMATAIIAAGIAAGNLRASLSIGE